MRHDTASAVSIIEAALEKGSSFREADSLLVFEVKFKASPIMYMLQTVADAFDRLSAVMVLLVGCRVDQGCRFLRAHVHPQQLVA